jgi:hypothetical protein
MLIQVRRNVLSRDQEDEEGWAHPFVRLIQDVPAATALCRPNRRIAVSI